MWNEGFHQSMMGDGGWLVPMGFHGLYSLLLVGVVIFGAVLVARHFAPRRDGDPALTALGSRYAAGEISREDYLAKKKDLSTG